jgi:hypothetical protein
MNELPCITTTMSGRPCAVIGEHVDACIWGQIIDRAAREHVEPDVILAARIEVGLPVPERACRGCVPRPARHGLLCDSCWSKLEAALGKAVELISHLRSVERGPQSVDGVRVAQGSKVIIPGSWLAADAVWSSLSRVAIEHAAARRIPEPEWPVSVTVGGADRLRKRQDGFDPTASIEDVAAAVRDLVDWLDPDDVVARQAPAVAAVEFFRTLQTTLHRFPLEEQPVRMPRLRCRGCGLFTVRQHPPLEHLSEIVYRCDHCQAETDPIMADWNVKVYAEEVWTGLTDEQRAHLLPQLRDDARRAVTRMFRSDIESMRDRVWERIGSVVGHNSDRTTWLNAARPEWGGRSASEMVEIGRGDEVLARLGGGAA